MRNSIILYPMQKRGQLETAVMVVGVIIIISSLVVGGIYSEKIISNNRYVGDKETNLVYDLSNCNINHISKLNRMPFDSLNEALKAGYNEAPCNKE